MVYDHTIVESLNTKPFEQFAPLFHRWGRRHSGIGLFRFRRYLYVQLQVRNVSIRKMPVTTGRHQVLYST